MRAGAGVVTWSRMFEALVPAGSRNESREPEAQAEDGRVRRRLPPDVLEDTLALPTRGCQTRLCRFWMPEEERLPVSPWASLLIQSLACIKLRLTRLVLLFMTSVGTEVRVMECDLARNRVDPSLASPSSSLLKLFGLEA